MSGKASLAGIVRAVTGASLALAVFYAFLPQAAWAGRVVIASEGARPPFNQLDEKGELAGFEIDLARDLCARAALDCVFVQQEWDRLLPGLEAGQYDAVMSTLAPDAERRARFAFGAPYLAVPSSFLAAREREVEGFSPAALAGRVIGVEQDTPHQVWVEKTYPESEVRPYASLEEAILDLAEKRLDRVFGPKDALAAFMKARREAQCCELLGDIPHDAAFFGEGFAMAFGKGAAALRDRFDKALEGARRDGALDRIAERRFEWLAR